MGRRHRKRKGSDVAAGQAQPIVDIRDLSLTYPGGVQALEHCSLSVRPGEFIVLTVIGTWFRGPNWAFFWSPADWPRH